MNTALIKKDPVSSSYIPYDCLVDDQTVLTAAGEYIQTIKFEGTSFESKDDDDLNNFHARLNILYRTISDPHLMLYIHTVRKEESTYPDGDFVVGSFAYDLDQTYKSRLEEDKLMVNDLYLSLVYKPSSAVSSEFLKKLITDTGKKNKKGLLTKCKEAGLNLLGLDYKSVVAGLAEEKRIALEHMHKLSDEISTALRHYEPESLSTYLYNAPGQKKAVPYSNQLEFYAYLVNGEWQRIPVPTGPISEAISTSRIFFGTDSFEIWMPDGSKKYGAVLGIKEPTPETYSGFLDNLLTLPFNYVQTQSFAFHHKETAKTKIKLQANRLATADDDAISQRLGLEEALDDVTSNVYVFGDFHFNIVVYGNTLKEVNDNVNLTRKALGDSGLIVTREDMANEAGFWAQLPGQTKLRPRMYMINSRNFAAFAPFHNYPQGSPKNNHWGDALTMFNTNSGTPYYFSFHARDPEEEDGGSLKDVGHTLIMGKTGSGKTVFQTFTSTMLQKYEGIRTVSLSKDYDTQLSIQANGGTYFPIKLGEKTGWNPFYTTDKPSELTKSFTYELMKVLLKHPEKPYSPIEEEELELSLNILWDLPKEARVMRRLKESLRTSDPEGLHRRLDKWINNGQYAWIFDNEVDTLDTMLSSSNTIGFDITEYLDVEAIKTPINLYLFHKINNLVDGRKFVLNVSEYWKLIQDVEMANYINDALKTWRKKNGTVILDSQSPADALKSAYSRTLVAQTATKIIFPDPEAMQEDYMEGMHLSEREFRLIKEELTPGSRQFLIKQGKHSVVAELNLKGFDYFLDILSTRTANLELAAKIQGKVGTNPKDWLPIFKEERKAMALRA